MQDKVRGSYNIVEYIKVYPMFTKAQCDQLIETYDKDLFRANSATPGGDKVLKSHRDCGVKVIKQNKLMEDLLADALLLYRQRFPFVPDNLKRIDSQFLKYDVNGRFNKHIDHYSGAARTLSASIILNDEFMGGTFQFWNEPGTAIIHEVLPVTGDILIFPSNFQYPHSVSPITFGTRYSIVNWFN